MANTDTITDIYAAFGRGDLASILERVAARVDWGVDPALEALPGAKAVPFLRHSTTPDEVAERYFGAIASSVDFLAFEPRAVLGDGDRVVSVIDASWTVRSTGVRLDLEEVHHFQFDGDGRIRRYRLHVDTARVIAAFGG
jgi:ketosteroid isomerase-like protein